VMGLVGQGQAESGHWPLQGGDHVGLAIGLIDPGGKDRLRRLPQGGTRGGRGCGVEGVG